MLTVSASTSIPNRPDNRPRVRLRCISPVPSQEVENNDWLHQLGGMAHGPSRVTMVGEGKAFAYRGNDPFWTQILGTWESRQDKLSPSSAHNWVLLVPCQYLAHYDRNRHEIIFVQKS